MNRNILHTDVQQFIFENLNSKITKLVLKGTPFPDITIQELANQIVSKQKCEQKLPTWFNTQNIYFPEKVSIEQTSSELTANYKAKLVKGKSIIDITGGFGVDAYYFSKYFDNVIHCELNEELSKIVNHNYEQLNVTNIITISNNGLDFLKKSTEKFDCIYIDPSRRNDDKGKVFLLKDCLPNVPQNLKLLFSRTDTVLIKNSPILDISSTINELNFVKEIHIVAVQNEVKELLFLLEKDYEGSIKIKTNNFLKNGIETFDFYYHSEAFSEYSEPLNYLYEPNAAILKSGGFHEVSSQLNIKKLHQNSHLYTSELLVNFPGRRFLIEKVMNYDKKQLLKYLPEKRGNITIRNFPKSVEHIRKETKIKDGGDNFLFFTKLQNQQNCIIICKKIHK